MLNSKVWKLNLLFSFVQWVTFFKDKNRVDEISLSFYVFCHKNLLTQFQSNLLLLLRSLPRTIRECLLSKFIHLSKLLEKSHFTFLFSAHQKAKQKLSFAEIDAICEHFMISLAKHTHKKELLMLKIKFCWILRKKFIILSANCKLRFFIILNYNHKPYKSHLNLCEPQSTKNLGKIEIKFARKNRDSINT